MKKRYAMLTILVALAFALSSCKSVETSSAKDQTDKGNYGQAGTMATRALTKDPNDAEAHFLLGQSNSYKEDMVGAYSEYMLAAKLNPKKLLDVEAAIRANWDRHYDGGMGVLERGDLGGAGREFLLATQADPRQIKAWLNLGKVYYSLAEKDSTYVPKTYAVVDSMLARNTKEEDPNYEKVLAFEGRMLARQGKTARAIEIFNELLSLDPASNQVVEESGVDALIRKDWQSAADLFPLVIDAQQKTNLEMFDPYYNLGVACLNLKDYAKAIDALQEALRIDPENKKGHYYLLLANYQGNQLDEAIHLGQIYTTKYADDQNGWRVLGLSYSKKGMSAKAQEAAEKAAALDRK